MADHAGDQPVPQPPAAPKAQDSAATDSWGAPTGDEQESRPRAQPAYLGDKAFYRIVVSCLCAISLASVTAVIWFHALGKPNPEVVIAMGSASVGALVSLVSPYGRP